VNVEQQISEIKGQMEIIVSDVDRICEKMDSYSDKYTHFLDMMIEREMDDKEFRKKLKDKLAGGVVWGGLCFVAMACYHYAKTMLK